MEYRPTTLDIEGASGTNLLETGRELRIAVVSYSPLGRGLLTGVFSTRESISGAGDLRATRLPRISEENLEANAKLVSQFTAIADKKGCTTSQLALVWLLKQGEDIIPIPGTKKIKCLEENGGVLDIYLTDEEEVEIRQFVERVELLGYRSTLAGAAVEFADTKEEA
jgi:aryl-alcohol dehydrogenase-like predicted oxidoreductase